jgi:hypothetical protein
VCYNFLRIKPNGLWEMVFVEYWYLYFIVIYLCIILPMMNRNTVRRIKNKKKRRLSPMSNELLKRFIGKKCYVMSYNSSFGETVTVDDVSENWMSVTAKDGTVKVINVDYIVSVSEAAEKKKKG